MRRSFLLAAAALLLAPAIAQAQSTLNVYQTIDIAAPAGKVWNAVKNWDNLHGWHPAFASTELTGGQNNTVGATRRLTLKDGPSFDEELTAFDERAMRLRYKIISEAPLPITNYDSTIRVLPTGSNSATVVWLSSFVSNPGTKDDELMKGVAGLYRAGLENLKSIVEGR
jgi:hypothetical protein